MKYFPYENASQLHVMYVNVLLILLVIISLYNYKRLNYFLNFVFEKKGKHF